MEECSVCGRDHNNYTHFQSRKWVYSEHIWMCALPVAVAVLVWLILATVVTPGNNSVVPFSAHLETLTTTLTTHLHETPLSIPFPSVYSNHAPPSPERQEVNDNNPPPCWKLDHSDPYTIKLRHLALLRYRNQAGEQEELRILERISGHWKKLCTQFGYDEDLIAESCNRGTASDAENCCHSVLKRWLDSGGTSEYPDSWTGLIKVLTDIEKIRVARDIEQALECVTNN